jgi:hypothetical protein
VCLLCAVKTIKEWPSGTKTSSAIVLRAAIDESVIPGKRIDVMVFAHVNPMTGVHEEDCSPLGDVAQRINLSQVVGLICYVFISLAFELTSYFFLIVDCETKAPNVGGKHSPFFTLRLVFRSQKSVEGQENDNREVRMHETRRW